MDKNKLCYGRKFIWLDAGKYSVQTNGISPPFPEGVKRMRLTCPECGRRILSSISICHDGCCLLHYLPPHKPKYWWKKKKDMSKHRERNIR